MQNTPNNMVYAVVSYYPMLNVLIYNTISKGEYDIGLKSYVLLNTT